MAVSCLFSMEFVWLVVLFGNNTHKTTLFASFMPYRLAVFSMLKCIMCYDTLNAHDTLATARGGNALDERQVASLRFRLDLSQPIYEQILQQMSSAVARGEIGLGEKIPSVRELAQALRVTPNTVMHAYQEMDRIGLTETRRGQGTFITTSQEKVEEFRTELARTVVDEFFHKMTSLGYGWTDIERYLKARQGGDEENDGGNYTV